MPRIQSLDLARGFTVLFIAPVHTILFFSKPEVYNTWLVQFLQFIAEGPGAQLFMLLMGISFSLSSKNTLCSTLKKSCLLLLAGYGLNFLKFVLPAMLDILPTGVYVELQVHRDIPGLLQMLLTGDILQFAAIAYLVIYLISKLPGYPFWAAVLLIIICFISPGFYDLHVTGKVEDYLLQLLGGAAPRTFFPLMPWLVYPLAGLVVGYFVKAQNELIFGYTMIAGFCLLLFSCSSWLPYQQESTTSFYRTYTPGTLYHLGLVLVWLYLFHWVSSDHPHRILTKSLSFLSHHITLIYFLQWLMICWALPFIGFRTLGFTSSMFAATAFGIGVLLVTGFLLLLKKY